MKKLIFWIALFFSLLLLSACKIEPDRKIEISKISWTFCEENSLPEDAETLVFVPLEYLGKKNLQKIAGNEGKYVWVKFDFEIPDDLKNKDLALFVSYIHFANKVWINGSFSGESGRFPPKVMSSQYQAHFYPLSNSVLNKDGNNTILIKVYCLGRAEISNHLFIGEYTGTKKYFDYINFSLSIVYMLFEGGMFATFLLYLVMYFMGQRKNKEYMSFSLCCYFTMMFATMFFAHAVPWYFLNPLSFLWFYKLVVITGYFGGAFFLSNFMLYYLEIKLPKWGKIIRYAYLAVQLIIVYTAPDYQSLINRAPFLVITNIIWLAGSIAANIIIIFDKKRRKKAVTLFIGILPLMIGAGVDFVIHGILDISDRPFFMYFGWQVSIIAYLSVLCVRFTRSSMENIYLNQNLQKEVDFQTNKLKETAVQLESELGRAKKDLEMASIVQQKSFMIPSRNFFGWDIAVSYQPLSEVSGDMFDFYNVGSQMTGFSLFDVSGHGIAASLITMLSKNIIYQVFKRIYNENVKSSTLMEAINYQIVKAKGDAENYLTGLLFQIDSFDKNQKCKIQLANAGHPYPLIYKSDSDSTLSIVPSDSKNQYGAIGIPEMEVSFQNIKFEMGVGDILVCFTDGIIEAENINGMQFGREYLKKIIEVYHEESAQVILDNLISEMKIFSEGVEREDDITVIVLKRTDPNAAIEEL